MTGAGVETLGEIGYAKFLSLTDRPAKLWQQLFGHMVSLEWFISQLFEAASTPVAVRAH